MSPNVIPLLRAEARYLLNVITSQLGANDTPLTEPFFYPNWRNGERVSAVAHLYFEISGRGRIQLIIMIGARLIEMA